MTSSANNHYIPKNLDTVCDYWLAILENHVLHTAFTKTAQVPKLHLEALYWSIKFVDDYFEFRLHQVNGRFRITLDDFKTLLNLPTVENSEPLPDQATMMNAITDLGYDGDLRLGKFNKKNFDARWYVIYTLFNRCLLMTPRGFDSITNIMLRTFYAFVKGSHVDYGKLLWEMVQQQVEKPKPTEAKYKYIPCERFYCIMIEYALTLCKQENVPVPDLSGQPFVEFSKVKYNNPKRPISVDSVRIPEHLVRLVPTTDERIRSYFREIGQDLPAPIQQPTVEPVRVPTQRSIKNPGGGSSKLRGVLKRTRPERSQPGQPLKRTKTVEVTTLSDTVSDHEPIYQTARVAQTVSNTKSGNESKPKDKPRQKSVGQPKTKITGIKKGVKSPAKTERSMSRPDVEISKSLENTSLSSTENPPAPQRQTCQEKHHEDVLPRTIGAHHDTHKDLSDPQMDDLASHNEQSSIIGGNTVSSHPVSTSININVVLDTTCAYRPAKLSPKNDSSIITRAKAAALSLQNETETENNTSTNGTRPKSPPIITKLPISPPRVPPPPTQTPTVNMSQHETCRRSETNVYEKPASQLTFQEIEALYIDRALTIDKIDELREAALPILQKAHQRYPDITCRPMIGPLKDKHDGS
ncbi:uncharacterized protein [Rutidosis leptorrhynchoides]|uniref:uncharacterized protein n=1 Tax=Rutidosis leptorrhynchoides TaxID=125765 RepID=UPI003A99EF2C